MATPETFPVAYDLTPLGWLHLLFFGVAVPLLVIKHRRKMTGAGGPLPDRLRHFQTAAIQGVMFAGASIAVSRLQHIDLFPPTLPSWRAIAAGVVAYAAAVAFMRPRWRRSVEKRSRVVHLFMPSNATERGWWIAVSTIAGIGEEITWRGVQMALVVALTDNYWLAIVLCAISFGLAHASQSWTAAAIIVAFGLGFHLLVWLAGSLYVAMAVHIAYDLTAGISYGRLGKELGYGQAGP